MLSQLCSSSSASALAAAAALVWAATMPTAHAAPAPASASAASTTPPAPAQQNITCHAPVVVGNLVSTGPSGIPRVTAFKSGLDAGGNLQLTTSYHDAPSPAYAQFAFLPCDSAVMPSGPTTNPQDGSTTYYGHLVPNYHRSKCVTPDSPQLTLVTGTRLSSEECELRDRTDDYLLLNQWFALIQRPGSTAAYDIEWVGHDRTGRYAAGGTNLTYPGWTNEYDARDDGHFVLLTNSDRPTNTGFKLQIRP
ncbi:hypothetical protein OC842_007175 [Tilletia horrida]|uniref:Uncharacterized protein n=1 Tax=Tilletia horrida TaxID=155126 RepID=A0AAN6JH82_9BASI|nr:hypothetical protein OC842_007175 [Tilletia horrida]